LRYKEPTDEPDAEIERDMNTFISLTKETICKDLKETLQLIKRVEKVAQKVEEVWINSTAQNRFETRDRAFRNLQELDVLIREKLDQATVPIIRNYEKYYNEKSILQIDEVADKVAIAIWASYENPKPGNKRLPPFENTGIQFETIPKTLLAELKVCDRLIFRVIRTPIVSFNMETYHQHAGIFDPHSNNNNNVITESSSSASALDNNTNHNQRSTTEVAGGGGGGGVVTAENTSSSIPSKVKRLPTLTSLPESAYSAVHSRHVVGDLIHFHLLVAPPLTHTSYVRRSKWIMRDASKSAQSLQLLSSYPGNAACKLWVKIPDSVCMTDDLRLCVWHEESKSWSESGIADFQYNESLRMIQCYLTTCGTFALVKKRVHELPYKRFRLFPVLGKQIYQFMKFQHQQSQLQQLESGSNHDTKNNNNIMQESADSSNNNNNNNNNNNVDSQSNNNNNENSNVGAEDSTNNNNNMESSAQSPDNNDNNVTHSDEVDHATHSKNNNKNPPYYNNTFIPDFLSNNISGGRVRGLVSTTQTRDSNSRYHHLGTASEVLYPATFERHCRVILATARHEMIIDVVGSQLALVAPHEIFVADLLGQMMSPGSLLFHLQQRGILLLPTSIDIFTARNGHVKVIIIFTIVHYT
jgi:hypothetical protein